MTRSIATRIAQTVDRPGLRIDLFGPLADLSGIDTAAPAASAAASAPGLAGRRSAGRLVGPPADISDAARADDPAFRRQAGPRRIASIPVYVPRRIEHGMVPLGLRNADEMGNESALVEMAVLVVDAPARAAEAAISRAAGRVRITLEEWPDG